MRARGWKVENTRCQHVPICEAIADTVPVDMNASLLRQKDGVRIQLSLGFMPTPAHREADRLRLREVAPFPWTVVALRPQAGAVVG